MVYNRPQIGRIRDDFTTFAIHLLAALLALLAGYLTGSKAA